MAVKLIKESSRKDEAVSAAAIMKGVEMILIVIDALSRILDKIDNDNPKYNKVKNSIKTLDTTAKDLKSVANS